MQNTVPFGVRCSFSSFDRNKDTKCQMSYYCLIPVTNVNPVVTDNIYRSGRKSAIISIRKSKPVYDTERSMNMNIKLNTANGLALTPAVLKDRGAVTVSDRAEHHGISVRQISEYVLFFWVYAVIGWLYEVTLETVVYHWGFTNRGVLFGPWLPVYGFGATVFLLLWYRMIKGKSWKRKVSMIPVIFLLTMLTATLIELLTSYLCEWTMGSWPWQTYADYEINFQARIALNPSIRFGLGGVAFLYAVQPVLDHLTAKLKDKTVVRAAVIILTVLAVDLTCTVIWR